MFRDTADFIAKLLCLLGTLMIPAVVSKVNKSSDEKIIAMSMVVVMFLMAANAIKQIFGNK